VAFDEASDMPSRILAGVAEFVASTTIVCAGEGGMLFKAAWIDEPFAIKEMHKTTATAIEKQGTQK